ncbi:hypothetical protein NGRA_2727 [Nosema granulosis]|uniref:Uncharacterized protein n=1 Tax=Nosema granulosis TaxID=83296 RepID=A0A9P6KXX4_9MICR|nr:hypothetical protein NGRA_2727 [Nosema granulosis]
MLTFPGEQNSLNLLSMNNKPIKQFAYPDLGSTCMVKVLKTTLLFGHVEIYQVNGLPTIIPYTGLIKLQDITSKEYISDVMKIGECFECTVVSYGDLGIYLVKN